MPLSCVCAIVLKSTKPQQTHRSPGKRRSTGGAVKARDDHRWCSISANIQAPRREATLPWSWGGCTREWRDGEAWNRDERRRRGADRHRESRGLVSAQGGDRRGMERLCRRARPSSRSDPPWSMKPMPAPLRASMACECNETTGAEHRSRFLNALSGRSRVVECAQFEAAPQH
jgi:hypothetical protein